VLTLALIPALWLACFGAQVVLDWRCGWPLANALGWPHP
jgi:hypothetical protein